MDTKLEAVHTPSHYQKKVDKVLLCVRHHLSQGSSMEEMECFDAMLNHLKTVDEIRGYLRGNSFKYRWRAPDKNGVIDLNKAAWHEAKLLHLEELLIKLSEEESK